MRNWSKYNPNLSSWINACLLAGLLIMATSLIPAIYNLWTFVVLISGWVFYFLVLLFSFIIVILPEFIQFIITGIISFLVSFFNNFITLVSPLVLLSPIPIIAFAHHYLYFLLDKYYPDLNPSERGRITGYFPNIVSWWHGLYGLLVIIFGMLISDAVLSIVPLISSSSFNCEFLQFSGSEPLAANHISFWVRIALMIFTRPIYSPFMRLVIWLISAAYLYQFEFQVRQHFVNSALIYGERER